MLIKANYYSLSPRRFIAGTKNSYGIETLGFEFSPEWDGLAKKVTFYPEKGSPVSVVYAGEPIKIPAEVMANAGLATFILSGYKDGATLISVTGYMDIIDTKLPSGGNAVEPTPDEMTQVLALMNKAVETANSVRRDADLGLFNGEKGEKGDAGNVLNVDEVVDEVKKRLPASDADEINAIGDLLDFEPVMISKLISKNQYYPFTGGSPSAEVAADFIKIPCKPNDVFKISFKGAIGLGTPCFIQNSSSEGIKAVVSTPAEAEDDKEKIFSIPSGGAYLVLNYYNKTGIPHVYRHKATDTSVWGLPSYWFSQLEKVKNAITAYQNEGKNTFTFGFLTDTHTSATHGGGFARLMKYILDSCEIPVFLHGGDIVEGAGRSSKETLVGEIKHSKEIFKDIEHKGLFAFGNHDASYGINDNYDGALSGGEIYNYIFRSNEAKGGVVNGETGKYFYKDNIAQKVRYIVLDSFALAENAMTGASQFGNKQLAWLTEALKVEEGYSIVLCSHIAPYRQSDITPVGWDVDIVPYDGYVALGIVNAYRNKTAYSCTHTIDTETYNISVDYSERKGGSIVCWLAGHCHKDYIFDIDGLKIITTANCGTSRSGIPDTYAPERAGGTPTEFIMDFVCVNRSSNTVNIVRLGAYLNYEEDSISIRSSKFETPENKPEDEETVIPPVTVKSFTLNDTVGDVESSGADSTYSFTEGMTWGEWKESGYNTVGFRSYENSNGVAIPVSNDFENSYLGVFDANGRPVQDNDVILEGSGNYDLKLADNYDGKLSATVASTDENYGSITIYFTEGMTWREWMESEDGKSHGAYGADTGEIKFDIDGTTHEFMEASVDDEIEPDRYYTAQPY